MTEYSNSAHQIILPMPKGEAPGVFERRDDGWWGKQGDSGWSPIVQRGFLVAALDRIALLEPLRKSNRKYRRLALEADQRADSAESQHPDRARLDWLDGEQRDDAPFITRHEHGHAVRIGAGLLATYPTIRDAIDAAMAADPSLAEGAAQ